MSSYNVSLVHKIAREKWLLSLFFVISSVAVFWIPWLFPPGVPVKGESYALGFNNSVAVGSLIGCVVVLGLLLFTRWGQKQSEVSCLSWLSELSRTQSAMRAGMQAWAFLAIVTLLQIVALLWWNSILVSPYWSESAYFLSRIDLLALGFAPYRDFQYVYGPAMLYGPLLLDRISFGWLGIESSYVVWIGVCYALGNVCLLVFLRGLSLSKAMFTVALAGGILLFLPITMGLNYVPLRFLLVPCLLVMFSGAESSTQGVPKRFTVLFGASFCAASACFLLSPEMGLAMCAGLLAYSSFLVFRRDANAGVATGCGVMAASMLIICVFSPEYFATLFTFKAGGNNFPIYPNLHNLTYLVAVLFVLPLLGCAALLQPKDARAPLAVGLCCAAGMLIFAAFGRCDPGHVFFNGLIPLLLMFAAAGSLGAAAGRAWCAVFTLCVAFNTVSYANHYVHLFRGSLEERRALDQSPGAYTEWSEMWDALKRLSPSGEHLNWVKPAAISENIIGFVNSGDVALFGVFDLGIDRLAKMKRGYRPAYHPMPTPEIFTMHDVERATNDLLKHDAILVPRDLVQSVDGSIDRVAYEKGISDFLSGLMVFPVSAQLCNEPFIPDREILRKVLAQTSQVPSPMEGMVMLLPKRDSSGD